MRALRYHAVGSLDHVRIDEIDRPSRGPGETLVKVVAAGVNPIDAKTVTAGAAGQSMPRTLGIDFAGTVEASERFAKGTRVFGSGQGFGVRRDGAFAEFACVPDDGLVELDGAISFEAAASLGVVFLTAHECLLGGAAARAEDTVVVHGAGGGLGQACVQIAAKIVGARTIAVVSSPEGDALARSLGAVETIDRKKVDVPEAIRTLTDGRGADVIIDVVGGAVFEASVVLLAPYGRVVSVGSSAGAERRVQFDLVEFYRANRRIVGVTSSSFTTPERARRLREIAGWVRDGKVVPPTLEVMPLDRGRDALARTMASEGTHGKLVLQL